MNSGEVERIGVGAGRDLVTSELQKLSSLVGLFRSIEIIDRLFARLALVSLILVHTQTSACRRNTAFCTSAAIASRKHFLTTAGTQACQNGRHGQDGAEDGADSH